MRTLSFTLMWMACAAAMSATVYKWVDENGVIHYSDQPHPGAQKMQIEPAQTYTPAPVTVPARVSAEEETAQDGQRYRRCDVLDPSDDDVLFNTSTVTVQLGIDPELRPEDRVVIVLDGRRLPGLPASGNVVTISPVYRGTHSLVAAVENARGEVLCQSAAITFHVRQPSVQAPNPANRPRF